MNTIGFCSICKQRFTLPRIRFNKYPVKKHHQAKERAYYYHKKLNGEYCLSNGLVLNIR